ncbi:MAG: hypothetical protein ACI9TH_001267 [Kiritimatiellia bacterium]|jgi:hypothetical protein
MRKLYKNARILSLLLLLIAVPHLGRAEVILQYFNTSWSEIERRMPELAEAGYTALWLPPPFKAGAGAYSVGFDTFDRFDLGDIDQSGSLPTKYGTKQELLRLMDVAHRFGIRVFFDNVMAHNAGGLDPSTGAGELFPNIPGFVPEDFHIGWNGSGWQKFADWPDWNNEWEVLNRNPFAWDIAQESGDNASFDPNGLLEGATHAKYSGIRHPGKTAWYPDLGLAAMTNQAGGVVHPFADRETYLDDGLDGTPDTQDLGEGNGRFDWDDLNSNGQHDLGEDSEVFVDTGVDPSVPWRLTAAWGYGDGIYNMGDPVPEDVNGMLLRALRWFVQEVRPDGFRLDAVKHVPDYFFGKQDGADKDSVNWGYTGALQEHFNLARGFTDWSNHRDTVFNPEFQAWDDAMVFGEHLGGPPGEAGYLNAGMRIAADGLLNLVKSTIGSNLNGMDHPGYGHYNANSSVSMSYIMSHDNDFLFGTDRASAHPWMILREGLPIVYTDGYHQAGEPDYFPKPSAIPFLGQFGDTYVTGALGVARDLARGYQVARWSDQDFLAYERIDNRENAQSNGNWNGATLLYLMARNYLGGFHHRPDVQTSFPSGTRLKNYSPHGGPFYVVVQGDGTIRDTGGATVGVPSGGYYAFGWRAPEMPAAWGSSLTAERQPIEIYQGGVRAGYMAHVRKDGPDGDPAFNPYGLADSDPTDYSYTRWIPRVTDGSDLRFVARADGSAENIRLQLDGGVNLNSHMGIGPTTGDLRDFPPGINGDLFDDQGDGDFNNDAVRQSSTDSYLGYEQMRFVHRVNEKFAAADISRNVIGSIGAESYEVVIGTAGSTSNLGNGPTSSQDTANWVYHDPAGDNQQAIPEPQFSPTPENATDQPITCWVKAAYSGEVDRIFLYYTVDGVSFPEGLAGTGKENTLAVEMSRAFYGDHDGTGFTEWWSGTLPAQPNGTTLRYKIGAAQNVAGSRFPWSETDITTGSRMETLFEIDNFDATSVTHHPHNDYGLMQTGLSDGYHVLRSRAYVGRYDGASIYKTSTQTFYYDANRPSGEVAFPRENDTLGGSTYGSVIFADSSVSEVWYTIEDLDPTNDSATDGNGTNNWAQATRSGSGTFQRDSGWAQVWRFEYKNIPNTGSANIRVRFKEASSSADNSLSDTEGWYTTVIRSVGTGSSINWNISIPNTSGEVVDEGWQMRVYFLDDLVSPGMTDEAFLDEVTVFIANVDSGSPDGGVAIDRSRYALVRHPDNLNEHRFDFTFPNLYNGDPDFLHHVRAVHERGSLTLSDSELVRMFPRAPTDTDGDGLPDVWENQHGLQALNAFGAHGGSGDYDEDGLNNLYEYIVKLSPIEDDHERAPRVKVWTLPDGRAEFNFPALSGRVQHLEWSSTVSNWQRLLSGLTVPTDQPMIFTDQGDVGRPHPMDVPRRHYRVVYQLP